MSENVIVFRKVRDFNLFACVRCRAVVPPEDLDEHLDWHEVLDRAIAEAARWKPEPLLASPVDIRHNPALLDTQ